MHCLLTAEMLRVSESGVSVCVRPVQLTKGELYGTSPTAGNQRGCDVKEGQELGQELHDDEAREPFRKAH